MHNVHDQYTKNLLRDALNLVSNVAETEVEVLAATQKIDVYATPDPAREHERWQLGLLGELSREASMFEPFSDTPNLYRFRACIRKQLGWHHELERRARVAAGQTEDDRDDASTKEHKEIVPFPRLVVISPGRPETVLRVFMGQRIHGGVYDLVEGIWACVVVIAELARTRATLLFRLMGSGAVLHEALQDFRNLPKDAWERCIATPLLVHFRFDQVFEEEDKLMSAEIRAWYEEHERKLRDEARKQGIDEGITQGITQGISQGITQGISQGERALLVRLLRTRFGELPASALKRIDAAKPEQLETWGERVLSARTLDDVLDGSN